MSTYRQYLKTLRRVPDDVILATAAADLCLNDPNACLCGWFVREQVARLLTLDPDSIDSQSDEVLEATGGDMVTDSCVSLFGGTRTSWRAIFNGVERTEEHIGEDFDLIERAFVERVLEAVR